MDDWFEVRCWSCSAWRRVDDAVVGPHWYGFTDPGVVESLWLPDLDLANAPCPHCGVLPLSGSSYDARVASPVLYAAEAARDAVPDAVADCLLDPAVIAQAIMSLTPEMRDHVRVLLDALEASGYDPST